MEFASTVADHSMLFLMQVHGEKFYGFVRIKLNFKNI